MAIPPNYRCDTLWLLQMGAGKSYKQSPLSAPRLATHHGRVSASISRHFCHNFRKVECDWLETRSRPRHRRLNFIMRGRGITADMWPMFDQVLTERTLHREGTYYRAFWLILAFMNLLSTFADLAGLSLKLPKIEDCSHLYSSFHRV